MKDLLTLALIGMLMVGTLAMTTDSPDDDVSPTTEEMSSTTTPAGGIVCKSGDSAQKVCVGGCFGLLVDGVVSWGCMGDLDFEGAGFTVTMCGADEKAGKCNQATTDGVETESCMGCCTDAETCNNKYEGKCDFPSTDSTCVVETTTAGAAERFASLSLLMLAAVLLKLL